MTVSPAPPAPPSLTTRDLEQLSSLGIPLEELGSQLAHFASPPAALSLLRPCRASDGVKILSEGEQEAALAAWAKASAAGRFSKFVPASGAASRMFKALSAFLESGTTDARAAAAAGDADAKEVAAFLDGLPRLAFERDLSDAAARLGVAEGDARGIVSAMLSREGLRYSEIPKGLIPFHRSPEGPWTPFEEHLAEAAAHAARADGLCRLHFTVAEEWLAPFEALASRAKARLEPELRARFEISFSIQHRSTDTIAAEGDGSPFRQKDGSLLFRPGGHGALLLNLQELGGDLVYLKNIDNVVPRARQPLVVLWKKLIGGHLALLEERVSEYLAAAADPKAPDLLLRRGLLFARDAFGHEGAEALLDASPAAVRAFLAGALDRPVRVCGVVRNEGEPGGGPFWVRDAAGRVSAQIVESSQVDAREPGQKEVWSKSTHFNPVDLVCSLRDPAGRPRALPRFVDPGTVFISRKSKDGRDLLALERPGLWNGAMAGWNTVFVEVPLATFAPVKTVLDLLRPDHQP
jgi:hypothetical protein